MTVKSQSRRIALFPAALLVLLGACSEDQPRPGEVSAFDAIGAGETISALGTEPFWTAEISESSLTYSTPENIDGVEVPVTRFAGNGGLGISGELQGEPLQLAITPGACSDAMSDREYPYIATLQIAGRTLEGCAYTESQPFTGPQEP